MLETIKTYINELPDIPFDTFYQEYICNIQDQNVQAEINNIKADEIVSLTKLLDSLRRLGL